MLGIEDYGSDSDNTDVTQVAESSATETAPITSKKRKGLALPPPSRKRGPKKLTIGLPDFKIPRDTSDDEKINDQLPAAKKFRTGSGVSSLLSMLPAPTKLTPEKPERVLGAGNGPGLVFKASTSQTFSDSDAFTTADEVPPMPIFTEAPLAKREANVLFMKELETSLGAKPIAGVDFFSLELNPKNAAQQAISSVPSLPSLSSAPDLPTFEIPDPTPTDPYPGYYQLPSGAWAAHDASFYAKFAKKWQDEYNAHVRALEKGAVKGFEALDSSSIEEVDAMKEMERAKKELQEREEKKAITMGAGGGRAEPKMKINASKLSGIARSRHQLSTMLKEAYENREALEEKIAEGRRNRKEAGNKYGF